MYVEMRIFPVHSVSFRKIWVLLNILNFNITLKFVNFVSKITFHHVKQHGIIQNLGNVYKFKEPGLVRGFFGLRFSGSM